MLGEARTPGERPGAPGGWEARAVRPGRHDGLARGSGRVRRRLAARSTLFAPTGCRWSCLGSCSLRRASECFSLNGLRGTCLPGCSLYQHGSCCAAPLLKRRRDGSAARSRGRGRSRGRRRGRRGAARGPGAGAEGRGPARGRGAARRAARTAARPAPTPPPGSGAPSPPAPRAPSRPGPTAARARAGKAGPGRRRLRRAQGPACVGPRGGGGGGDSGPGRTAQGHGRGGPGSGEGGPRAHGRADSGPWGRPARPGLGGPAWGLGKGRKRRDVGAGDPEGSRAPAREGGAARGEPAAVRARLRGRQGPGTHAGPEAGARAARLVPCGDGAASVGVAAARFPQSSAPPSLPRPERGADAALPISQSGDTEARTPGGDRPCLPQGHVASHPWLGARVRRNACLWAAGLDGEGAALAAAASPAVGAGAGARATRPVGGGGDGRVGGRAAPSRASSA